MMNRGRLVFVTTELYPFTGGGIGRFTYNVLKSLSSDDLRRTTILLTHGKIANAAFEIMFPGAELRQLSEWTALAEDSQFAESPEDEWLSISIRILVLLRRIAAIGPIAYLEFPDWSGLGFATTQEKHLTGFLWDTVIAVRIHSTEAILVLEESRLLRPSDLRRFDLERKCYRDCDVLVAHLEPVAERTRLSFGFTQQEWLPRLHIAAPPIDINGRTSREESIVPNLNTSIVFSSKFQEFKRPHIFVQGAIHFLNTNAGYQGDIVLACSGLKSDYAQRILDTVPPQFRKRLKLLEGAKEKTRDDLIASSIVVFPTSFESYCFAAYEAAALGAIVVLNEQNPAFGKETPWIDQKNCLKFDGSALGMSHALAKCFELSKELSAVVPQSDAQAWEAPKIDGHGPWRALDHEPLVSVVIVNQNEGILLGDTLESIFAQGYSNLELIIVDDGSSDAVSPLVLEALKSGTEKRITAQRLLVPVGRAAARNWAIERITGEYVMHVNSGDFVQKDQIGTAITCLENNAQFDVVVSQAAYFSDVDRVAIDNLRVDAFVGEAMVSGTVFNYFAGSGWICRGKLAKAIPYRPEVGYLDNWAWMFDAVNSGKRIVASPRIGVLIRDRAGEDIGTPIIEYGRLRHLLVANAPVRLAKFSIASFSSLCQAHGTSQRDRGAQEWYQHMIANAYEGEVEFMANFFGHTWLGKFLRRNTFFSSILERLIRTLARMR